MFPKHPKMMTDDELCRWVKLLIDRQAPESNNLDYKTNIDIRTVESKIEIGKDVSSFANDQGGVLLYGVPETDSNGVPVPHALYSCGIALENDLPSKIENILLDVIVPPLPELHVRVLTLPELSAKSILLIYHPESWNKPHMIEGYKEARYYRRGSFRSIVMKEREVEAAYSARKISMAHASEFFNTGDFKPLPKVGRFLRVVVCPRFPLLRKQEMLEEQFKKWLDNNPPNDRRGDWIPFLDGWTFRGYPAGQYYGKQYEFQLFHNGGLCFTMELERAIADNQYLNLNGMSTVFKDTILPYAKKAFEILKMNGPVAIQVKLHNVQGLNALFEPGQWIQNTTYGASALLTESLSFTEEFSVIELEINFENVLMRLIDRLASAFGIWRR